MLAGGRVLDGHGLDAHLARRRGHAPAQQQRKRLPKNASKRPGACINYSAPSAASPEQRVHIKLPVVPNDALEIESQARQNRLSNGLDLLRDVMLAIERVLHIVYGLGSDCCDDVRA